MKEQEFRVLDNLADEVYDKLNALHESGEWKEILKAMAKANASLPESFSISLRFSLEVFHSEKEREVVVLTDGYAASKGHEPYRAGGDSTVHRYIVDGEICQIPHNYCPKCWGEWDFKLVSEECPECGVVLGEDIKLLLDTDVCPHCEEGKVTMNSPVCSRCGYEVDPRKIVWG